jgi:hypothetical protein
MSIGLQGRGGTQRDERRRLGSHDAGVVAFVMVDENAERVEEWSEPCQKIDMWGDLSSRR